MVWSLCPTVQAQELPSIDADGAALTTKDNIPFDVPFLLKVDLSKIADEKVAKIQDLYYSIRESSPDYS